MRPRARRKSLRADTGAPLSPLPSAAGQGTRAPRWPILILLALYVAAAIVHSRLVPVGQTGYQNAPDEAAHVNYIRTLAAGHLPTRQEAGLDPRRQSYEWHQPPLYYLVALPAHGGGVYALRVVSIVCGVAAILLIYRIALLLFPEDPDLAVVAAAVAALTPGHIAITSTVNNDALLEVCFSGVVLTLIAALRNGFTLWRAGWLGVALGAALLTKTTGLLLIPVIGLALLLFARSGEKTSTLLRGTVWCAVVGAGICGWWYLRNAMLYHEWLPFKAFEQSFSGTAQAADVVSGKIPIPLPAEGWPGYWLLVATMSFESFWAVYGTPRLAVQGIPKFLPEQIYLLMALIVLAAIAGMARLHFRRQEVTETQQRALWLLFAVFTLVLIAFVAFLAHYFQTQGRYLYPAMSAISILIALGWRSLFPKQYKNLASALLIVLLGAMTFIFLTAVQAAVS